MSATFENTPPSQRGEKLVDGINYMAIRFELMMMEVEILNAWLKRMSDHNINEIKLLDAEKYFHQSVNTLTNTLINSGQLIKKLRDEINNRGQIATKNSGVEMQAEGSKRNSEG